LTLLQITSVKVRPDNILQIEFNDGRKGVLDVKPFLFKSEYRELTDPQLFQQVKTDGLKLYWPRNHELSIQMVEENLQQG